MATIDFEGVQHEFPDDFSQADIAKALASMSTPANKALRGTGLSVSEPRPPIPPALQPWETPPGGTPPPMSLGRAAEIAASPITSIPGAASEAGRFASNPNEWSRQHFNAATSNSGPGDIGDNPVEQAYGSAAMTGLAIPGTGSNIAQGVRTTGQVIGGAAKGAAKAIAKKPLVIPALAGTGELIGGHQGAAVGSAIGTGLVGIPGAIEGGMEAYRSGRGARLAAEHRAGPQPVPSWRGNPEPQVTPPPQAQSIPGALPSGRQPGPAPPGPEFPNRQIPAWANMPNPQVASIPEAQSIPSQLPSGRQVGPAPPRPEMQGRAIPAWATAPEPAPATPEIDTPIKVHDTPSGKKVPSAEERLARANSKVEPKPEPAAPAEPQSPSAKPDAQAAAEALKNEMGGIPGKPLVIPSTEQPVTKTQGASIGRKTKIGNAMDRLRGNGVTPQTWKSLTSQEKASATKFINELPGYSKESRAQLLSALEGDEIPRYAKGGLVAPIPGRKPKPGRMSSRGHWYGPPGSAPVNPNHA